MCTIDFGDYTLTGIPENFDDYVNSAGTSVDTHKLADLFMQISKQLEQNGYTQGAQDYKDLANL